MKKNRQTKSAKEFFNKLLKDPTTRMLFEVEKSKTEIAFAVRSARQKADLTQSQLAKKIGTTQSVIARLESGADKRIPSIPLLSKIASACGAQFEFGFTFLKAS